MSIDLIDFLENKMSMTQYYQPVIIAELLEHGGKCSKEQLAASLVKYDDSVLDYYKKIIMVWPKSTLEKHGVISYDKSLQEFSLNASLKFEEVEQAKLLCEDKLAEWKSKQKANNEPSFQPATRYRVLKRSNGKCELCGTPSSRRPIDIDHIVPQSTAKNGKVLKNGKLIAVHSDENLQALCFKCNRAKSNKDNTDFRKTSKLVRDNIPEFIRKEGRIPVVEELDGKKLTSALYEKLDEEHEEFLEACRATGKETSKDVEAKTIEELADMIEVIFAIAKIKGTTEQGLMAVREAKRLKNGGFEKGYFLKGDKR
jgi:predicted house-cleaning noncanonical NTP pyrophosphatase (MazG superfamily)|tara:strand:+ start:63 stop:1001 length:939 start_codon:yes stop_codon:yes gene_type:complete